jgi:hypothetical protein
MTVQDELNRAAPMLDGLNAAIRENPLAAGLIGAGVAWMLMGGAKGFGTVAGVARAAAGKAGSMAGSAAATAGSAVAGGLASASAGITGAVSGIKDVTTEVAGSVGSIVPDLSVSDTVDSAGSMIGERFNAAADAGRAYSSVLQSRLSESLERQPLLLGALGVAIGAGIASTFATTRIEGELMGEHGTAAREKLQEFATDAKDRAQQAVSEMTDEAGKHGLTLDGVKNAAGDVAEKVKTVADEVRGSKPQASSPAAQP